jgi:hypothetical protein
MQQKQKAQLTPAAASLANPTMVFQSNIDSFFFLSMEYTDPLHNRSEQIIWPKKKGIL